MLKGLFAQPYVKFVAKKAVFYAIVIIVAITFVFLISRCMPGSPLRRWLAGIAHQQGPGGQNIEVIKKALEEHFGLDKPLFEQYINFWRQLIAGNLGLSFAHYPVPVVKLVLQRLPYTLGLVVPVLLISFFLGNWIGAKAAYVGGKRSELIYFFSVFSNQLPTFWFAMILLFLLTTQVRLFPFVGAYSSWVVPLEVRWSWAAFSDLLWHYCLPFLALFIVYLGGWATGMRSMVTHEMDSGYVRYSDQLGFRKSKSMSYAKRNAILPQFTGLNLYLSALIGETTVIEVVFGWPGLGRLMYEGVLENDYPLIFGGFLVTIFVVILGNFLVDILYGFIDPRIRIGQGR